MWHRFGAVFCLATLVLLNGLLPAAEQDTPGGNATGAADKPQDPAAAATAVRDVPMSRPEQQLTDHDRSDMFNPTKPAPLTPALKGQPKAGRITGFDFARDPLNADKPFTTFEEVMAKESAQTSGDGRRSNGNCWRAVTTSSRSSTRRPRCPGASRSASGRRPGCRRA